MKKHFFIVLFLCLITLINAQEIYHKTFKLMGSRFDISVVCANEKEAEKHIAMAVTEMSRIEHIISSWNGSSETSEVNRQAGIQPVRVSKELFHLIKRANVISKLTRGAFDISYASMDRIWKFDGSMKRFPSIEKIKKSIIKVGYQHIILNEKNQTIYLTKKGMKIGFGAIGKGFAADKAKALLISKGVKAGIINASGDMNTWGKQPDGSYWNVAITNPMNKNSAFALLPLKKGAIVTSGNYEKYVQFNGQKYSHIIDPRTGIPSKGILSVSVFSGSAELADALATSIFVMGTEIGINRINQLPNIECIIIDDKGKVHTSKNININKNEK